MPYNRKVVLTGASDARDPCSRSVKAESASLRMMSSSPAGPRTTCRADESAAIDRTAGAPLAGRSAMACRIGATVLLDQQIGASGAGSAGSTKAVEAPRGRPACAASDARDVEAGLEGPRGLYEPFAVELEVALIVGIAPQELPGEIGAAQRAGVIVGTLKGWPRRTNIMPFARHGTKLTDNS